MQVFGEGLKKNIDKILGVPERIELAAAISVGFRQSSLYLGISDLRGAGCTESGFENEQIPKRSSFREWT